MCRIQAHNSLLTLLLFLVACRIIVVSLRLSFFLLASQPPSLGGSRCSGIDSQKLLIFLLVLVLLIPFSFNHLAFLFIISCAI